MAALTFYATNTLVSNHQEMSTTSPGANATSSPAVGWTVGTTAPTVYSEFDGGTKQASGTFSATVRPDGSINTAGDCLRSTSTLTGTFSSANWTITFSVIGVTQSGAQDGRARFRLFRSANADGSSAAEITAGVQIGSTITNLSTTQQDSAVTFNPGSFSLTNEYLFVQVGWEITGAGGMSTTDVVMRIGSTATRVVTSNFAGTYSSTVDDTAITVTDSAFGTDFPDIANFPMTGLWMGNHSFAISWVGRASLGGSSSGRDLATAGSDPASGSLYHTRRSYLFATTAKRLDAKTSGGTALNTGNLFNASGSWSGGVLFKVTDNGASQFLLYDSNDDFYVNILNVSGVPQITVRYFGTSGLVFNAYLAPAYDQWLFLHFRRDTSTSQLEVGVNGTWGTPTTSATNIATPTGNLIVGSTAATASGFAGEILGIFTTNTLLTDANFITIRSELAWQFGLSLSTGTTINATVDDTAISVSDSASRSVDFGRAVSESVSATETIIRGLDYGRGGNDVIIVTDQGLRSSEFGRINSDAAVVTDQGSFVAEYGRSASDAVNVTDTGLRSLEFGRASSDSASVTDTGSGSRQFDRIVDDSSGSASTILTITTFPQTFTTGNWPQTALNSGKYHFTWTPTAASTDAAWGTGFYSLIASGGTPSGTDNGGLWIHADAIELYNQTGTVFSQAITWGAGAVIQVTIDMVAGSLTISGASTGNGTFSFTPSGTCFTAGTLGVGIYGGGGFSLPASTISSLDDAATGGGILVTDSVTGANETGLDRAVNDSASVTDASTREVVFERLSSDAASISDSASKELVIGRLPSDAVTVTDSGNASRELERSSNDSASTTDASSIAFDLSRSSNDSALTTDSIAKELVYERMPSDAIVVADSGNASRDFGRSNNDTVSTTDSLSSGFERSRTIDDAVVVSDQLTRVHDASRFASDTVNVTDAATKSLEYERSSNDSVATTDSGSKSIEYARVNQDAVIVTDQGSRGLDFGRASSDAVSVTDTASRGLDAERIQFDTISVTDQVTRQASYVRYIDDTVILTDDSFFDIAGVVSAVVIDTIAVTDLVATMLDMARVQSDTAVVTDSGTASRDKSRTASDAVSTTDQLTWTRNRDRLASDTVGVTDSSTSSVFFARFIDDALIVTDLATKEASYHRILADTMSTVDDLTYQKSAIIDRQVNDSATVTDLINSSRDIARETSDAIAVIDAAVRELFLERAVDDDVLVIDSTQLESAIVREIFDAIDVLDSFAVEVIQLPVAIIRIGAATLKIVRAQASATVERSDAQVQLDRSSVARTTIDQSSIATVIIKKGTP